MIDQPDFVIINKPHDLSFHSESNQPGIFAKLEKQFGIKLWPVHRLDKLTSGLLIFAKSKKSAAELGRMFEEKEINKTYLAISDKKSNKKQGHIIGDMKKSRSGNWILCKTKINPAKTTFQSISLTPGQRLFLISPSTGKTHQIRVALKAMGSPILGDKRYGGSDADRGYLHAYQLKFDWYGKSFEVTCLPNEGEYFNIPKLKLVIAKIE